MSSKRPWLRLEPAAKRGRFPNDTFYQSVQWRKLREAHIKDEPTCRHCWEKRQLAVPGRIVDHIKPRDKHPELELDASNLQTLCQRCHNRKTAKDKQLGR